MMRWLYLLFLLIWVLIIALQWLAGWKKLWPERRTWPRVVLALTLYFSLADALAIQQHIWFFNPELITQWSIGNVPIEEVLFYLLTTTMIVQGFIMLSPDKTPAAPGPKSLS